MMSVGVLTDCSCVLVGGLLGTVLGSRFTPALREKLTMVLGFASMAIGINSIVKANQMTPVVIAVIFGTLLGELLHLEEHITHVFGAVTRKLPHDEANFDMERYITVVVLFCASGFGIYGVLVEGMSGSPAVLQSKAMLDLCTAAVFAVTLGVAVAVIALPMLAVMLALTAFAVSNLGFLPGSDINMSIFSIRTLVDFSGVLILTVQHEQLRENALHGELAAMDEVLHRQYEQYKRSKEGINLINRRYHELKIQLARIREEQDQTKQNAAIAAMEQNIRQYEAENKTGNPVLDTLLTAKTMECQQENITITSVADGRMLGFLTIRELCTIVGVALDNAIAAVRAEPDPEKRLIKVAVYSQGGFAMLRFEHYTEAAPALDADGLPKQGSDLKSVRTTAQQHGGSMTMHWENNWCTLRILFPLPQNE